jgi:Fe2+-dicitrate sensor, membrane component
LETGKIKQLLQRYLLGRVSQWEEATVDEWYESFDEEPLAPLSAAEEQGIRDEIWQRISPQIRPLKPFYRRTWVRAAAAVLLIAGATSSYFLWKAAYNSAPAYTEIHTGNRERKTVQLPDGSQLTLNAGSTLRIPDDQSAERKVQLLDGEVFFDVQPDTRRPFIVESGPLRTTVLGTSFNISAYQDIHQLSITVTSGKISVAGKSAAGVLQQGQAMVYDKIKETGRIGTAANGRPEWMQGRLVLNDVSFTEMSVLVEKNFGIRISSSQDHIRESRYTAVLNTNMEPAAVVEVLAAIHQFKTRIVNNQIIMYE